MGEVAKSLEQNALEGFGGVKMDAGAFDGPDKDTCCACLGGGDWLF
jgi:hypothetical protein